VESLAMYTVAVASGLAAALRGAAAAVPGRLTAVAAPAPSTAAPVRKRLRLVTAVAIRDGAVQLLVVRLIRHS
jgi:hypothetical protein